MTACGRQWCAACAEELIHRDHRKGYESASALGQIIWREGPARLTVCDMDILARKGLRDGSTLFRGLEQKNPDHTLKDPQEQNLSLLDAMIRHCVECPAYAGKLDPRSGIYVIRGEVAGATEGTRKTVFHGPQEIIRLRDRASVTITDHEQFFRFLDPQDRQRRSRSEDKEARWLAATKLRSTRRPLDLSRPADGVR